jgi:hypothetical protein
MTLLWAETVKGILPDDFLEAIHITFWSFFYIAEKLSEA